MSFGPKTNEVFYRDLRQHEEEAATVKRKVQQLEILKSDLDAQQSKLHGIEEELKVKQSQLSTLQQRNVSLKQEIAFTQTTTEDLEKEEIRMKDEEKSANLHAEKLKKESEACSQQLEAADELLNIVTSRMEAHRGELDGILSLQSLIQNVETESSLLEKDVLEFKTTQAHLTQCIEEAKKELVDQEENHSLLLGALREQQERIHELRKDSLFNRQKRSVRQFLEESAGLVKLGFASVEKASMRSTAAQKPFTTVGGTVLHKETIAGFHVTPSKQPSAPAPQKVHHPIITRDRKQVAQSILQQVELLDRMQPTEE